MPSSSDPRGYSALQIWLHWTIAALVVVQLVINQSIGREFLMQPDRWGLTLQAGTLLHVLCGLSILALSLLRLGVRLVRGTPPPPPSAPKLMQLVGDYAHRGLYLLLLATALTGAVAWFGRSEPAAMLHELCRWALVALILAHAAGALVEQFVLRTRVIGRMLDAGDPP